MGILNICCFFLIESEDIWVSPLLLLPIPLALSTLLATPSHFFSSHNIYARIAKFLSWDFLRLKLYANPVLISLSWVGHPAWFHPLLPNTHLSITTTPRTKTLTPSRPLFYLLSEFHHSISLKTKLLSEKRGFSELWLKGEWREKGGG